MLRLALQLLMPPESRLRRVAVAMRGWWRQGASATSVPAREGARVTCVLDAAAGDPWLSTTVERLRAQTWSGFEIVVLVDAAANGPHGVCRLLRPAGGDGVGRELAELALDLCLEVPPARRPLGRQFLEHMVRRLESAPDTDTVASDGHRLRDDGPVRLRRNRPSGAAGTIAIADADLLRACTGQADRHAVRCVAAAGPAAAAVDADLVRADGPLPTGTARPVLVLFGDDPDQPWRTRDLLAREDCVALTADPATAARLRVLTPRTLLGAPLPRLLAAGLAIVEKAQTRAAPATARALRPAPPPSLRHIALQVDHFLEGGMEQVVIDLAETMQHAGFSVTLLVLGRTGPARDRAVRRGLRVVTMAPEPARYEGFLRDEAVGLVNAHYSTFGAAICAAARVPFVHTLHNMYVWFDAAKIAEYAAAEPHTHAYLCVSNLVAAFADRRVGLSPAKMIVVPNGCDARFRGSVAAAAAVADLRRELGLPPTARVLLNVASIRPPKAQHLLLRAFAAIAGRHRDAVLVFLGDEGEPDYARRLRAEGESLGLGARLRWVGHRDDVATFHVLADALVMPSFFEGWSLAITEAVLAGLPVIATDVGGAREQLRGTDGILLAPAREDLASLGCEPLVELLESPCDELVQRLGAALTAILERGGRRSRLPADADGLLREHAYTRYVEVFRWLVMGGDPASARFWTRPRPLPAGSSA